MRYDGMATPQSSITHNLSYARIACSAANSPPFPPFVAARVVQGSPMGEPPGEPPPLGGPSAPWTPCAHPQHALCAMAR